MAGCGAGARWTAAGVFLGVPDHRVPEPVDQPLEDVCEDMNCNRAETQGDGADHGEQTRGRAACKGSEARGVRPIELPFGASSASETPSILLLRASCVSAYLKSRDTSVNSAS